MKSLSLLAVILIGLSFITGCGKEGNDEPKREVNEQSELIRSEGADLAALDINGDGTLYQCPMHFQVVSDEKETCPLCKMDLESYSLTDAQSNFEKHYSK